MFFCLLMSPSGLYIRKYFLFVTFVSNSLLMLVLANEILPLQFAKLTCSLFLSTTKRK